MRSIRGGDWRLWGVIVGLVAVCCAQAPAADVRVIHGHDSVPEGERRFAAALARHVTRWYREVGLEAETADDTALDKKLSGQRVAVLVYVSQPTEVQVAACRAFVEQGGRLIVCYSASAALGELMGVRVTGYQRAGTDGRWSAMRFAASRPAGVPEEIRQTSPNLMAAQPVEGRASVLAWWVDRAGQATDPAWLVSNNGYWMTHVLLADGDAAAKGRLLLGLAASADPSLWGKAARRLLEQARLAGAYTSPAAIETAAQKVADPAKRVRAVVAAQAAARWEREIRERLRTGQGFDAWNGVITLQGRMREAYGLLQTARNGEIRAVWDHSGMGLYPGNWKRTCMLLDAAGVSDLLVNVGGAGFAHYASDVLPRSRIFVEQGDQLRACIDAARPYGIRVHAWLLCYSTEQATPDRLAIFGKRGWLLTHPDGRDRPWLDPAVPEVRDYLTRAVREVAERYAPDGVHLDFVRYPDFNGSLGPTVRSRFEQALGRRLKAWPQDVGWGGPERPAFMRWRTEQVGRFVGDARLALRAHAPGKLLTAAVFGKYPSCVEAVGQDWEAWLRNGLLDYAMPMNYTESLEAFQALVADQTRTRTLARQIIPGIGVTAAESRLDPIQVIDQIRALRQAGCPGFALFDLDTTLQQEILPVLRLGMME
ncbi:MAG: hypothetical protein FJ222_09615 [Lentisphaerae bacterium]|nr:hypothetical protein [Lentisphaerota bacterium]